MAVSLDESKSADSAPSSQPNQNPKLAHPFYSIGKSIHILSKHINSLIMSDSTKTVDIMSEFMTIQSKYKIGFYIVSTIVYIIKKAMKNHKISESQVSYINDLCELWEVNDKDKRKCFGIGGDYTIELCVSWKTIYKHFNLQSNDKTEMASLNGIKRYLILSTLIAMAIDNCGNNNNENNGKTIVKNDNQASGSQHNETKNDDSESTYTNDINIVIDDSNLQITQISLNIGLTKNDIKQCIEIINMEITMANKLKQFLTPTV